jgi:penicillin-binding protein 2
MSTPAPDPNDFVSGIAYTPYKALQDDERIPLVHKAYDGIYPPGSTFKIVVAAAALEAGVHPEDSVYCSGRAWYYNRFYHCWKPEGHGRVNLHTGIQKSCDCYFYAIAERIGIEKIAEVGKKFGLMHRYELGVSGGKRGVMPNDEWKRGRFKEQWYAGDTISAAIGQGYVLATPFELAVMTARIAGGHATPDPRLVASGIDVPDQTIEHLDGVKEETLARVRAGMYAVTSEPGGTGLKYGALDEKNELPAPYTGARMSGKSGTAQVRKIDISERTAGGKALGNEHFEWRLRDHALFVAYAPHDNPRYAVSIVVEHGGSGSGVAAPFAADILKHCLKYDPGAKPVYQPQAVAAAATRPT